MNFTKKYKIIAYLIIPFALIIGGGVLLSQSYKDCEAWNDINFKLTEKKLLKSPIKKILPLHEYLKKPKRKTLLGVDQKPINRSIFILFLEDNLKAVFKPNRSSTAMESAYLAYQFSQFMKLKLVPPTVIRTINGNTGIVQLFIDSITAKKTDPSKNLTAIKKSQIYIFNFVLGESNPHKGNFLFGKKCNSPALIDNELVFWPAYFEYGDYPYISYSKTMEHGVSGSLIAYRDFPKNKIISLKAQSIFSNETISPTHKELIKKHFEWFFSPKYLTDGLLHLAIGEKDILWIKQNFQDYTYIYKQFLPTAVPKKIIRQLKELNHDNLASLFYLFKARKNIILGILHRRDIVLKKMSDCVSRFKQLECQNSH